MNAAGLGLTCKEALLVFSQNETLKLQARVSELENELSVMKKMYFKQLERIEWAADVMWKHGIRCGCSYGMCDTCDQHEDTCTCRIQTCRCKDCEEDNRDWCNDQVNGGLLAEWYHPKGQVNVRWDGGAQRYCAMCDDEPIPPQPAYCGFIVCDPEWYLSMNVLRDDTHTDVIDVTTPELLERFQNKLS